MDGSCDSRHSSDSSNLYSPSTHELQSPSLQGPPDVTIRTPSAEHTTLRDNQLSPATPLMSMNGEILKDAPGPRKRKWSTDVGGANPYGHVSTQGQSKLVGSDHTQGHFTATPLGQKRAKIGGDGLELEKRGESPHYSAIHPTGPGLPPQIWQHVFTFLPPLSLGRALLVNRMFRDLLTPSNGNTDHHGPTKGRLKYQRPDLIWTSSRKGFLSGLPRPLAETSELEMWKLIRGQKCQFCGKPGSASSQTTSAWESGPGPAGVRVIWQFGVRSCATCLNERVHKEMDLLFSSTVPSMLLPALSFAFFTQSMHLVLSTTLRTSSPPPGVQLTKYFSQKHLQGLKRKFDEVKLLGSATAEEWFKGLESNGKDKLVDAARWEQWEAAGGFLSLKKALVNHHPVLQSVTEDITKAALDDGSNRSTPFQSGQASQHDIRVRSPATFTVAHATGSSLPPRPLTPQSRPNFPQPMNAMHRPAPVPVPMQMHAPQPRVERSIRDVNEAKAIRRAEIERRCLELNPPLSASVLIHMESFAAAIQIPTPMTDNAWEVLKPRLLAQREIAEQRAEERKMQSELLQAKTEERRQQEAQLKEAKETLDREWDDIQKPIRDRMAAYAEEIIRDQWKGGNAITKDQCPKLAADVLLYVRERFVQDMAREDANALASSRPISEDPPNAPPTRKLILDNMKWVFDTKIKPLTEHYQKELFLCNGCENNSKYYGFEGVVQHYAAKHTNVLSMGSVVVHWRAEWPEQPPFHPNPNAAKSSYYISANSSAGSGPIYPGAPSVHSSVPGLNNPGNDQGSLVLEATQTYPQPSPGPYGQSQYPGQYPPYRHEPYRAASPPAINNYYQAHQGPPYGYPPQQPGYSPVAPHYQTMHIQQPPPQHTMYSPYPSHAYPTSYSGIDSRSTPSYAGPSPYGAQIAAPTFPAPYAYPPRASGGAPSGPPGQIYGIYQVQLGELAKNARDIWDGTSGIKDLPSSIRIHVLIHHVVLKFKDRFTNEPNLALFTDALNNNAQMKPIRTLNGLSCKACANGAEFGFLQSHPQPLHGEKKLYALPALLSHFQSVHVERAKPSIIPQTGIETPRLDWKFDMVELPDKSMISALLRAPGMDDAKLKIIATVFPEAFPSPLPKIGTIALPEELIEGPSVSRDATYGTMETGLTSPYYPSDNRASPTLGSQSSRHRGLEVRVDDFPKFVDSPLADPAQPEPAREDEYDPHRPAYIEPHRDQYGRVEQRRPRPQFSPLGSSSLGSEDLRFTSRRVGHIQFSNGSHRTEREPTHEKQNTRYPAPLQDFRYHSNHGHNSSPSRVPPSYQDPEGSIDRSRLNGIEAAGRSVDGRPQPHPSGEHKTSPLAEVAVVNQSAFVKNEQILTSPPIESISAAEHFLNNFDPTAEDHDEYGTQARETDNRGRLLDEASDERTWRADAATGGAVESSLHGTPTHKGSQNGWSTKRTNNPSAAFGDYDTRQDVRTSALQPSAHRVSELPLELPELHYIRKDAVHQDARSIVDQAGRRPNSRFDRYEAQRQESQRPRSISPQSREQHPTETSYYRERSPLPQPSSRTVYSAHSAEALRDRRPVDEPITYTRIPAAGQYQYVDEPRYRGGSYNGGVEYIPVRVAAREPYYIERPARREVPQDYVGYEEGYTRESVIEHNGQLYRAASGAQDTHDMQEQYDRPIRYR